MPRKPFLLRIDDQVLASIQRWAATDMRSLNGQIEYLLRDALRRSGRLPRRDAADEAAVHESEPEQE
ncbi:MAG: type II toxin-antitoxin system antitoxin [Gemmatimonadaceae bacterium]